MVSENIEGLTIPMNRPASLATSRSTCANCKTLSLGLGLWTRAGPRSRLHSRPVPWYAGLCEEAIVAGGCSGIQCCCTGTLRPWVV